MKRAILLTSILLLGVSMALAQYGTSTGTSQEQSSSSQTSVGSNQTIDGCLSKVGSDYFLTTIGSNPMQYQVTGDTSKLIAHVDHHVAITGDVQQGNQMNAPTGTNSATGSSGTSAGMMNSQPAGTIAMQSFRHISVQCAR